MNGNFKRNLVISSIISIVILLTSSTASYISIKSLRASNDMVNHTQQIIYNLNRSNAILLEAQTSMRGYLITGKTELLKQFTDAEKNTDYYIDKVEKLTIDNNSQQQSIRKIKPLHKEYFKFLARRISDKANGLPTASSDLNAGRNLMGKIQSILDKMEHQEKALLTQRIEVAERHGMYSTWLIIWAAFIAVIISLLFFTRILTDFKERGRLYEELEEKENETANRIAAISSIAGQISQGHYAVRVNVEQSDALGSVGHSLNNMAASLEKSFTSLSNQEWLQTGVANLNNVMLGEKSVAKLTTDVIEFLSSYTASNAGSLYIYSDNLLHLSATFSVIRHPKRNKLQLGEGLIGQAAASQRLMQLETINTDNITISYALGEISPSHVIAFPLIDGDLAGAIELATTGLFEKRIISFLNNVSNNIAIAIKAAQNREKVQELLGETQAQSEELRVQHTELESMNAELETQTEKLQASEEELRVQQEELQQTNEELAERSTLLEERNAEIQKKSEDLELSTRYKSEFLANMSHELRTPLNSILLLSRLLSENSEKNMTDEQIEFARVIQSSGNGLLGLIDEILDLSKIEAGKMNLEMLEVSMQDITDGLQALFLPLANEKQIAFKIIADRAPMMIKTDKMRLEQILKNLISNAIKFTSDGAVTLEIEPSVDDDRMVYFHVTDTGIGIPSEKQPLIFEAFQQADGSTKRKYGGTGLGLSISRELAKLLNGTITLKSTAGKGSRFSLLVPISGTAVNTELAAPIINEIQQEAKTTVVSPYVSPKIPNEIPDDRDQINEGDKVILIVEDDTAFAKSLLKYTRKNNYKGVVCVRGDQALNFAIKFKPLGVLLDIQLPVQSGWEVMEALKANAQTRHIPVHIMSSHQLRQESLLKGAVNFLDKPGAYEQMPDVFQRIEQIINRDAQKVLIIEDNPKHAKALAYFLETHNINSEIKSEVYAGIDALQNEEVHCVILDMGIPDQQAYQVLEDIKKSEGAKDLPIIVFTGRSLSLKEELKIKKYADSIVVKTAHSYQRMLDEVSLFLHLMEEGKKTTGRKQGMLADVLSGKIVLVVDDDVRNIYSLTKALEALKMQVITATDGKEALKVLDENPKTDVVLLDMMMPNMDGYETAQRIRKNPKFKSLPVIAVTAKAMTGDRDKCINAGASDYITKPVDADQLLSLLRVWLYDKN